MREACEGGGVAVGSKDWEVDLGKTSLGVEGLGEREGGGGSTRRTWGVSRGAGVPVPEVSGRLRPRCRPANRMPRLARLGRGTLAAGGRNSRLQS